MEDIFRKMFGINCNFDLDNLEGDLKEKWRIFKIEMKKYEDSLINECMIKNKCI